MALARDQNLSEAWFRRGFLHHLQKDYSAAIADFRAAGCSYFVLNPICEPPEEREQLELIGAEVLPRLRA